MDLEVARADRRDDAVPVAPGLRERLRDRRLAGAVEPEHSPRAGCRARSSTRRSGSVSRARGHSCCSSAGGPGRTTTGARPVSRTNPGAVPTRPRESAPSGSVACFRTPGSKSVYGRRSRSAIRRETAPISSLSPSSRSSARPAAFATSSTVRSSCVGPSPPETTHRSASSAIPSTASSSSGSSPTIEIRAGSTPSTSSWPARNGPFRSVRSPRTSSLPVTTIAARGRNYRAARRGRSGCAAAPPPTGTSLPFSFIRTFSGEPR